MFGKRFFAVAVSASMIGATACQYTEGHETQTGALVGAASGAGLGAIIGNQSGDAGKGALIGGLAGAALGTGIGYAMERQRKEFERRLDDVQVSQQNYVGPGAPQGGTQAIVLTMNDQILFERNSAMLLPSAQNTLSEVVSIIKQEPTPPSRIVITGHTDAATGSYDYNMRLSQDRAEAVRTYMISRGIDPGILLAQGAGPNDPIGDNNTLSGQSMNRRVEIRIIP